MSLFFVNCDTTILFSVKRDLDLPLLFTTLLCSQRLDFHQKINGMHETERYHGRGRLMEVRHVQLRQTVDHRITASPHQLVDERIPMNRAYHGFRCHLDEL